jgi:hypothetical protein
MIRVRQQTTQGHVLERNKGLVSVVLVKRGMECAVMQVPKSMVKVKTKMQTERKKHAGKKSTFPANWTILALQAASLKVKQVRWSP